MGKILIVDDLGDHNYKYLSEVMNNLRDKFTFSISNTEEINSIEELNKYDLICTSNCHQLRLRVKHEGELHPLILSWNHSMLGPVSFNNYHNHKEKLDRNLKGNVKTLCPRYYQNMTDESIRDDIKTSYYYRYFYLFKINEIYTSSISTPTYFNHWSVTSKSVFDIVNRIKNDQSDNYKVSNKVNVVLHPCYYTNLDDTNPLIKYKKMSELDVYTFINELRSIDGVELVTPSTADKLNYTTTYYDGYSGTLTENIIKSTMAHDNKTITLLNHIETGTISHNIDDHQIILNMMNDLGTNINNTKIVLKLKGFSNKNEELRKYFSIPDSLNEVRDYYIRLFNQLINKSI